ncbi:MAG TPA: EAL domain-containing protein [Rubrobacteraceae bacterium]|nr:EAL domain-containing protein [Rubrobacteraceae bacterium]
MRGLHEVDELVSPGAMLGAAGEAGLLFNLDRTACIKAIGEADGFGLEQNIFINFDPTLIHYPGSRLGSTLGAVERSNLCPERIVFEVTESEQIKDQKRPRRILEFCCKSGFKVALDDLGAGSSSLDLLSSLRPDFVKLDANLVRDVDRGPYRAMIASRLLKLAKDLGVTVVTEGVETEEQWLWLVAHAATSCRASSADPPLPRPCLLPSTHRSAGETFQTHLA